MGELVAALVPEMIGLAITPAAVIGSVLLLQSKRAVPTVLSFAGGFLAVCALVAGSALIGGAGRADPAEDAGEVRSWVGVGVGGPLPRRRPDRPAPGLDSLLVFCKC